MHMNLVNKIHVDNVTIGYDSNKKFLSWIGNIFIKMERERETRKWNNKNKKPEKKMQNKVVGDIIYATGTSIYDKI